jgi:cyclopropane-fatty-acyl-phospholipid synthase
MENVDNLNSLMVISITLIIISISIYFKFFNSNPKELITKLITENTTIQIGKELIIKNDIFFNKLLDQGELGLAESYMDGDWESNDVGGLLKKLMFYQDILEEKAKYQSVNFIYLKLLSTYESFFNTNTLEKSPGNIQKHYDVGNDLYNKMLGKTMQYTCAYFNKDNMTLDEAQESKMELIAKKLDLKEGMEVIDIGCGFGSMANYLATNYKVKVTGVTLSPEQKKFSDEYFGNENVSIEVKDYRLVTGKFDRVYSVGMFEHIGSKNYKEYFDKCYELLKDDGIMFCHTMGISRPNDHQNEYFASNYIFPEGELPDMLNLTEGYSEKWRLEDFQNIGISYSKTFDAWRENIGNWETLEEYDERFKRMWEYYLHLFSENFRCQNFLLFQNVFTKKTYNRSDDCLFIRN